MFEFFKLSFYHFIPIVNVIDCFVKGTSINYGFKLHLFHLYWMEMSIKEIKEE